MSEDQHPERRYEYLGHIVEATEKVARYTASLDKRAFLADEKTQDAVVRNLEIVGETIQQSLPDLERQLRQILAGDAGDPPDSGSR